MNTLIDALKGLQDEMRTSINAELFDQYNQGYHASTKRWLERVQELSNFIAEHERSDSMRTRSFWSPDRTLLITEFVSADSIEMSDDNGVIYESAGPEITFSDAELPIPKPGEA